MGKKRKKTVAPDSNAPVRDAASLWNIFNREGRLYPETHDETFIAALREGLHVPNGEEITDFLKRTPTDTTKFMLAVLNALAPLGCMLSEIYALFVRHGLKESDDKILVEFDFGEAAGKLKFTADHFRTVLRALSQIRLSIDAHEFTRRDLYEIFINIGGALADVNGQPPDDFPFNRILGVSPGGEPIRLSSIPEILRNWLERGDDAQRPGRSWPYTTLPPLPDFSMPDPLHQALGPLINAVSDLCAVSRRYPSYEAFEAAAGPLGEPGVDIRATVDLWSLGAVRYHQSDGLALLILRLLWHIHLLAPRESQSQSQSRQDLAQRIVDIIERHSTLIKSQTPAQALEQLLDLPLWKSREKIYSIWLVTVVEGAFNAGQFFMKGEDGRLVFAFGKTLVAEIRTPAAEVDLIAEMRTPAGDVKLVRRTQGVQPDYILCSRDHSQQERVVYVLEVKQYAKASLKNFSEALYDYAAVHKSALVSLVNYGPMTKSIYAAVGEIATELKVEGLVERCTAFGDVRPLSPAMIASVQQHIRQAIGHLGATNASFSTLIVDVSESILQVLPDGLRDGLRELWRALSTSRMPMTFAAHGFIQTYEAGSLRDVAQLARSHLQSSALALGEIEPIQRKGAVLLTDESGFKECAPFYPELAAVIVLHGPDSATIQINPHFRAQIEGQLSALLKFAPSAALTINAV